MAEDPEAGHVGARGRTVLVHHLLYEYIYVFDTIREHMCNRMTP